MAWDTEFLDLMPHSIIIHAFSSRKVDGSPAYAASGTTYRGRVNQTSRQVRDDKGNVVMAAQVAWIASTSPLNVNSRYRLPAGTGGSTTPPVLRVDNFSDEDGVNHHRVYFGA